MNYWAPEVHLYCGKFYMFASFKVQNVCHCAQILVSDSPEDPFVSFLDNEDNLNFVLPPPNKSPDELPVIIPIIEKDGKLVLK